MNSALQTKLLIAVVALLASLVSYVAFQRHEQQVEQRKVDNLGKPVTPSDRQAVNAAANWASAVNKSQLK